MFRGWEFWLDVRNWTVGFELSPHGYLVIICLGPIILSHTKKAG